MQKLLRRVPNLFLDVPELFLNVQKLLRDVPELFLNVPKQLLDVQKLFRTMRKLFPDIQKPSANIHNLLDYQPKELLHAEIKKAAQRGSLAGSAYMSWMV